VQEAIEARADELFRRYTADRETCADVEVPGRATLRAFALAELCRAGGAVDVASTRPPRPEMTLVMTADERSGTVAVGRDGARVAEAAVRTVCCDPDLFALVVDSLGQPVDLGRRVRLASGLQRRALAARDGGCVFPGCTAPAAWTDCHHVKPFKHGGGTDLSNLASVCRAHHGIAHRNGWTMHATPDGWWWWTSPSGRTFWSQRHQRRRTGPTPGDEPPPQTAHPEAA
jgi:putative intracellular protease/amidase